MSRQTEQRQVRLKMIKAALEYRRQQRHLARSPRDEQGKLAKAARQLFIESLKIRQPGDRI
jgi:hypothetical protein